MEDRRFILEMLDRHEGQLALGIYPSELSAVLDACDSMNGLLDFVTGVTKSIYPTLEEVAPDLQGEFKTAIANAEETRNDNGPVYELARFTKDNLVFKSPNGGELDQQQVDKNRMKLNDYRRQMVSSDV